MAKRIEDSSSGDDKKFAIKEEELSQEIGIAIAAPREKRNYSKFMNEYRQFLTFSKREPDDDSYTDMYRS